MIRSFRNGALRRYWIKNDPSRVRPDWRKRTLAILRALDQARRPEDLNLPGFGFHALKGDRRGEYAVTVSRNWRVTFAWDEGATDIDLEDYHAG